MLAGRLSFVGFEVTTWLHGTRLYETLQAQGGAELQLPFRLVQSRW